MGTPPPAPVLEIGGQADGLAVFAEGDGTIAAVRLSDGLRLWHRRPGGPVGAGLAAVDGLVLYADSWGQVGALRADDGEPVWVRRRSGWGDSFAVARDGVLAVAGGDGVLYGFDLGEGRQLWRVRTAVRPRSAPAIDGGRVYTAADGGHRLLAVDLLTGRHLQSGAVSAPARFVAAEGGDIWVAGDGSVHGYGAGLEARWSRWLGTELTAAPAPLRGLLACAGANGYLYALDPASGDELWSKDLGSAPTGAPIGVAAGLAVATAAGQVVALAQDGDPRWSQAFATSGPARLEAGSQARIYLSGDGQLYAFDPAPRHRAAGDTLWWEATSRGDKTGYGWQLRQDHPDGSARYTTSHAVGWRHGFVQLHTELALDAATLRLRRAERHKVDDNQVVRTVATASRDSLRLERSLGESRESWAVPLPVAATVVEAAVEVVAGRGLEPGTRDSLLVVDFDTGVVRHLTAEVGQADSSGAIPIRLRHGAAVGPPPPAAADLSADLVPELEMVVWVDGAGSELGSEVPALGSAVRRVSAAQAREWTSPPPPATLRLDHPVAEPERLDSLTIGLPASLGDPRRLFVLDGRQHLQADSSGAVLVVRRQPPPAAAVLIGKLSARPDLAPYLEPSLYIQSAHPRIRDLALRLVPDPASQDSWAAARVLADWVHDHMVPADTNVRFKSSLEVLDDLEGTCSEYTVLFAALCRAAGIPARVTVGYAVARDGELVLHIWPQVFVGQWMEVDPAWGAFPVEAAHIKTGQGLLHPAHLERLNLPLEWISARADTLPLVAYGAGGSPPFLAAAERLFGQARDADRNFDGEAAQQARYRLCQLPWNHRSGETLVEIAREHLARGQLDDAEAALRRLQRHDPDGAEADDALLYLSMAEEKRGRTGPAIALLGQLVADYPQADRADDGLGHLAELVEKAQGCGAARPHYQRLAQAYAGSGWASVARAALERCDRDETAADGGAAPDEPALDGSGRRSYP